MKKSSAQSVLSSERFGSNAMMRSYNPYCMCVPPLPPPPPFFDGGKKKKAQARPPPWPKSPRPLPFRRRALRRLHV
ncbi:hypothetical protein QE152_g26086 [Popillia japonica]|uniref:Uncharacterized protein n=1 Tax=Popillia japonica TaxID=7064 RepID=A0AAW1JZF5_POPJA